MFNLADVFIAASRRWKDCMAVESPEYSVTYAGLAARAGSLAEILRAEGVVPGDRVGVALAANSEALVAMLALWLLGATPLVADFRSRGAEREKMVTALKLRAYIEDRPAPGGGDYPSIRLDAGWIDRVQAGSDELSAAYGNAVAAIGVSSGTSGMPQPVALTHECLYLRAALARASAQWIPGGRFIVSAPLAFSATRKHVLSRLLDGGTVIFTSLLISPRDLVAEVQRAKANAMLTVPAVARGMLEFAPGSAPLFPELDYMMCCGAPMTPQEKVECLQRLCHGFVQNYGSSMAGMVTVLESADVEAHAESVGRPLDQVLVEIVDAQHRPLPAGEAGMIRIRTPGVAAEMVLEGLEQRTSDLVIDGWVYPGDVGVLDQEGFLSIVGRTSDVINRGGVNVYPTEIENVLASHAAVKEAAVVGWPDPVLGEEIAAFVTVSAEVSPRELVVWCVGQLHPDKQPRQVFVIEDFPRNANGKLVRRELVSRLPVRGA